MYLMFKKIVFFNSADTELKLTAKKERKKEKKTTIKFLNPCLPIYGFEFRLGPKH